MPTDRSSEQSSLRVAVIGIGTAGVSALRWCAARREFAQIVGFDGESGCGGVWRAGSGHSPAYDSLYMNSSKYMVVLGDHPERNEREFGETYPSHAAMRRYYEDYLASVVEANPGRLLVRWRTKVERLAKRGKHWAVVVRDMEGDNELKEELFDRVIVATGRLWDPSFPRWAQPLFEAENRFRNDVRHNGMHVMHAREYRNPEPFHGKRVIVVGVGNSALDISLELSRDPNVPKPIYVSCRTGPVFMPMSGESGFPNDVVTTSRAFQYLASPAARIKIMDSLAETVNKRLRQLGVPPPPNQKMLFAAENPVSNVKEASAYVEAVEKGLIQFISGVQDFAPRPNAVKLSDGFEMEGIGAVILSTGYRFGMDFLEDGLREDILKRVKQKSGREVEYADLYKSTLYAKDPTLGFLVLVTSFGNESIIGWMQARWLSKALTDEAFLRRVFSPEQAKKESEAKHKNAQRSAMPYYVRYLPYMDDLAKDLGVLPDLRDAFERDRSLGLKLLFGSTMSAQYLLKGEDASPAAIEVLKSNI